MTNVTAWLLTFLFPMAGAEPTFLQTCRGRRVFGEVERISRNHSFNEYRGGELTLRPYVQLEDHSFIGLDGSGRLMQVIETPERVLGFLMSGDRHLVDVFVTPDHVLVAIDEGGQLWTFDRARWEQSPRESIQRKLLASFGLSQLTAGLIEAYASLEWDLPLSDVLVPGIPVAVALTLQHGLFFAMALSRENDLTDGLRPLGITLDEYHSAEAVNAHGGGADEYVIHSSAEPLIEKDYRECRSRIERSF